MAVLRGKVRQLTDTAQAKGYAQRNFATQAWLAADAHTDQRGIRLMRQLLVVLDTLGVHDMSAQEQESEAVESLPYWLVADWAWGLRYKTDALDQILCWCMRRHTTEEEAAGLIPV